MDWREVVEHPSLKNLPFKIETNKWGKIMMTPPSILHGVYQSFICSTLARLIKGGKIVTECSVQTSEGVRVADVAWGSEAFIKKHGIRILKFLESPEVVVEIESPSNTAAELEEKRHLYFEVGAREFWLCNEEGNMRFFSPQGELERSGLFGEFPKHIEIDVP
ncbi:MAG: Uma2 family endonuclease [Syntrophobacteraceae bacterium]|nr:Uma2 family endonuclease [Syntrophobacteraceae bacterium]